MSSLTRIAVITQVPIGKGSIEGVRFVDTKEVEFGIAVVQVASQFQFDTNQASRKLKSLLGKDFQFDKARTEINPKAVNVLTLIQYERVLRLLDRAGNKQAQSVVDDLIGLSLHQIFCDAFDLEFEKRDRQDWLENRQNTKESYRELTDALKGYGFNESDQYRNFVFMMQSRLDIETKTRDLQTTQKLRMLDKTQVKLAMMIKEQKLDPYKALNQMIIN